MHFAGSAGARENYIDPSVREKRGPRDDRGDKNVALSFGGEEPALSLSKGSMHFAGSAGVRENYIDPSVREKRGPQDDKGETRMWRCRLAAKSLP